jgi:protein-S-isoprenylcysteine O-methyltransferase Ste14
MERARYILALWCVALFPPAVLFWFALHPFVDFWRRRGTRVTYVVLVTGMLAMAVVLVLLRDRFMAVDYGFRWPLALVGVVLVVVGSVFDKKAKEHLKFRILAGVPELEGTGETEALLTDGIYARVRHPRYTGVAFSLMGVALITNYLALYVVTVLSIVALWVVAALEERELMDRFGEAYRAYRSRVPRFLPRPRGGLG